MHLVERGIAGVAVEVCLAHAPDLITGDAVPLQLRAVAPDVLPQPALVKAGLPAIGACTVQLCMPMPSSHLCE